MNLFGISSFHIFATIYYTKHQVPRTITYNNLSDMEQKEGEKSELLKLVQEHSVPWDDPVYDYIADQELEELKMQAEIDEINERTLEESIAQETEAGCISDRAMDKERAIQAELIDQQLDTWSDIAID